MKQFLLFISMTAMLVSTTVFARSEKYVDEVVAVVNNDVITKHELDNMLHMMKINPSKTTDRTKIRQVALDRMIDERLLKQNMSKSEISVSEEEIASSMNDFLRARGITKEQLRVGLAQQGSSIGALQNQMVDQIRQMKFIQSEVGKNVRLSEDELRNFYQRNMGQFDKVSRARVSQIFIDVKDTKDEKEWKSARKKARKLSKEARNGEFEKVAKKNSDDAAAKNGGDLGIVDPTKLHPKVGNAIMRLKIGQVSEPIRSTKGYHILKVTDRGSISEDDFKRLKPQIEQALYQTKMSGALEQYLAAMRSKAFIEILDTNEK